MLPFLSSSLALSSVYLLPFLRISLSLVVVLFSFYRYSRLSFTFNDYVFIWSCYATFLMSLSTGKQSRRPPDLKSTVHSVHVLSRFIYVCLSGRIIFSIHERNLYLDTRSTYQLDTYILYLLRFTLRLVDSIFSIHRRIDLKFCN